MGKVEDYWDKLRLLREAQQFTEDDIEWLKEMTEACEKAEAGDSKRR